MNSASSLIKMSNILTLLSHGKLDAVSSDTDTYSLFMKLSRFFIHIAFQAWKRNEMPIKQTTKETCRNLFYVNTILLVNWMTFSLNMSMTLKIFYVMILLHYFHIPDQFFFCHRKIQVKILWYFSFTNDEAFLQTKKIWKHVIDWNDFSVKEATE